MRVVLVTPELWPYSVESPTADWAHQLIAMWRQTGHEVAVFSPRYKCVARQRYDLVPEARRLRTRLLPRAKEYSIYRLRDSQVPMYFVDKESLFFRDGLVHQSDGKLYPDTAQRFAFFLQAALESLRVLDWEPQIIHAIGWPCASLPWMLQGSSWTGFYRSIRTIVTLDHPPAFRRVEHSKDLEDMFGGLKTAICDGGICLEREAMRTADVVQVLSDTVRSDLVSGRVGSVLQPYSGQRAPFIHALPMSIDTQRWNPTTDPYLAQTYGPERQSGKAANAALLAESLGVDSLAPVALATLNSPAAIRLFMELGTHLRDQFQWIGIVPTSLLAFRDAFWTWGFKDVVHDKDDRALSRVLGGAQLLLDLDPYNWTSSLLLKAFRYGVIPVVHQAGAAKDWVIDASDETGRANGFVFPFLEQGAIEDALRRVVHARNQPEHWQMLQRHAMRAEVGITPHAVSVLTQLAEQVVSGRRVEGIAGGVSVGDATTYPIRWTDEGQPRV